MKRAWKKFLEDVLSKGIYDIAKIVVWAVVPAIFAVFGLIPEGNKLGDFLGNVISISTFWFILILLSSISATIFASHIASRKRLALMKHDLFTDELTGIPNGKSLKEDLAKTISWAKSENMHFSIILMDIDDFKLFNTKYGYDTADEVMAKLGAYLKSDNRSTDKVYRQHLKVDEFIIIAKETTLNGAVKAANRKRDSIAKLSIQVDGRQVPMKLTVSCGVVEFNPNKDDEQKILERAFGALKLAKSTPGKNATIELM